MENEIIQPVNAGEEVVAQPQTEVETVVSNESTDPTETQSQKTEGTTTQTQEENSKYAAARREAEKKAKELEEKVKRLEGLAVKSGYESVESFTEAYERQLLEIEEQQRREQLEEQGIDPDIYEQMLLNDPRIQAYNQAQNERSQAEKRSREIDEFLSYFEKANGRPYDARIDKLTEEVERLALSGVPLVVAYKSEAETMSLRNELEQLKAQFEAVKTNELNSISSTGSIVAGNPQDSEFISREIFDANKGNQKWVIKNLDKITQSRLKW